VTGGLTVAQIRAAERLDDVIESRWGDRAAERLYRLSRRDLLRRLEMLDQQRQRLVVQLDDLDRRRRDLTQHAEQIRPSLTPGLFGAEVVGKALAPAVRLLDACKRGAQIIVTHRRIVETVPTRSGPGVAAVTHSVAGADTDRSGS
jgi:hypothetical protein